MLEREIEKVESFYSRRLEVLQKQISCLTLDSPSCDQGPGSPTSLLCESSPSLYVSDPRAARLEQIEDCRINCMKLSKFANMNLTGIRKILKKYDKKAQGRSNLLSTYGKRPSSCVKLATAQTDLGALLKYLDEEAKRLVLDATGAEGRALIPNQGPGKILHEVRDIWDRMYSLQVKSVLERDSVEDLAEICKSLNLARSVNDSLDSQTDVTMSSVDLVGQHWSMTFVKREHLVLVMQLLDGICANAAVESFKYLQQSGLNIPLLENTLHVSILSLFFKHLPKFPKAHANSVKLFRLFIESGASTDWRDNLGKSIVHRAVVSENLDCLNVLLECNVDPYPVDEDGWTPLFFAIQQGAPQIVDLLLMHRPSEPGFPLLGESQENIDPLIAACKLGHEQVIKILLNHGFDKNTVDHEGESALYHCAKRNFPECLQLLLEAGADTEIKENYKGWTCLFAAAAGGHREVCDILLKWGANINVSDQGCWTPFEHCMFRGHIELANILKPATLQSPHSLNIPKVVNFEEGAKEYGHYYLENRKVLRIVLGHKSGPNTDCPAVEFVDRPLAGLNGLVLVIGTRENSELFSFDLPLQDEPEAVEILLEDQGACVYSTRDPIYFDLRDDASGGAGSLLGRGFILLHEFINEDGSSRHPSSSRHVLPICGKNSLEIVAFVYVEALVVTPFTHLNLQVGKKTYWKSLKTKLIGHRGTGANSIGVSYPQIGENTVLSFVTAASLGAEYVEFDVQVTRDKVPVLYHDFIVGESGLEVGVSGLTLNQFLALRERGGPSHACNRSGSLKCQAMDDSALHYRASVPRALPSATGSPATIKARQIIQSPFATLKDAFRKVPQEIGFNVEVKYPVLEELVQHKLFHVHEINEHCEAILKVVYDEAQNRPIIFSSFHPDICLLLSLKQPNYPVFFLTESGQTQWSKDVRTTSLQKAIQFAQSSRLLGIVSLSTPLIEAPRLIRVVKEHGLLLFTYGDRNNEIEAVQLQQRQGVDAVIVDMVARIRQGLAQHI